MRQQNTDKQPVNISLQQARRLAIHTQMLDGRTRVPSGKEGIAQTVEKLGYIQIDTIAVIERAHHHTLWTRRPDYNPDMLHDLQAKDRRVFEYWGRQASYLPMTDYRFYLRRMEQFANGENKWDKTLRKQCMHLTGPVLDRIRAEGPLSSKDFTPPKDDRQGAWWHWNPYKMALELLFWRGELMITERRKFQRIYDLTERVLPENTDTTPPTDDELGRFLVRRALSAYGVASEAEIRDHIHAADKDIITAALHDLTGSGEITPVTVTGIDNSDYYALTDMIDTASRLRKNKPRLHLLSPFDNLIIQRDRTRRLFDFDYTLECYVPAPKRKAGYFVLPVLYGEQFAGRLDPKADRKTKTLVVKKLILENGFEKDDSFLALLAEKLRELARFNDCEKIKVEKSAPANICAEINRLAR